MSTADRGDVPVEHVLHDVLCRRDAPALAAILRDHPELRARLNEPLFPFDSPALVHFAADPAMVAVLLDAGADPNRRSSWWAGGFHPLHSASPESAERLLAAGSIPDACAAAHLDRPDLLRRLLAEDPSRVHERGGDGQTPLHFARSRDVIDLLLAAGADPNARDVDHHSTPAQWMLERKAGAGRYELARYLVERGAEADLFLAAALGLADRVRMMVERQPSLLDLRTSEGEYAPKPPASYHIYFWTIGDNRSPLDVAAQFEQAETLEVLLASASPVQRFLFACRRGDAAGARAVLANDPSLVARMPKEAHRALADAAWNGEAGAVRLMLELGFDPRVTGHDGGTPLHLASWEGAPEIVEALLTHPDAATLIGLRDAHYGATPLGWCCHGSLNGNRRHDHAGVARLLVGAGAPIPPDPIQASPEVLAVLERAKGRS